MCLASSASKSSQILIFQDHSLTDRFRVLKTTKSGWAGFLKDRYTTLPETDERILATEINAEWSCPEGADYRRVYNVVKATLMRVFFGPVDTGVFSKGVQETLYKMGAAVVRDVPEVDGITISLPNLHFLPCSIPVFAKNAVKFEDDVFIPSSEPHGIISATIERSRAKL